MLTLPQVFGFNVQIKACYARITRINFNRSSQKRHLPTPMNNPIIKKAILALCLAVPSMLLASPQVEVVKAIGVRGDVTITNNETGRVSRLAEDALFTAGTTVSTGKNSSATVMFSTGTFIAVPSNTTFVVETFEQEAFSSDKGEFETLKVEPSVSDLRIKLVDGRMTGRTAKLTPDSNLQIDCEVGAVTITGTIWDISATVDTVNNNTVLTISNLEGGVTYNLGSRFASVQSGDSMTVSFNEAGQDPGEILIVANGSMSAVDARAILEFLLSDLANSTTTTDTIPDPDVPFLDITVISIEQ